jgi:hypothetical protein
MQPHINDNASFSSPFSNERASFYGFSGTPSIAVDGNWQIEGSYQSCTLDANAYRNAINARLNATGGLSPVAVTGVYSFDESTITLSATFELLDPLTLVSPKAYLAVTESNIHYGSYTYNHVVRAGTGQLVTLTNVGDQATLTQVFPRGSWNMNNVECVAFLQRSTGTLAQKQVYQAAKLPMVSDFRFMYECAIGSAPHGNGLVDFTGTLTNIGDATDDLTVSLNNTFGWTAEFKLANEASFHSTPSTIALGPDESIDVTLRVTTDDVARTGSGSLVVTSANSERTQVNPVTVYNGSPSILVVDDDGMYNYEAVITNGLTAANYVYTTWDAYYGHGGAGPTYADMKCFDVVIWHTGYPIHTLSATEIADIQDYMDGGRGFIFSSQDALAGLSAGTFTQDYLGVASWTQNVGATQATGVAGDPISDGTSFGLTYPYTSWNRADDLVPSAYGTEIFTSQGQNTIAMRCDNGTAKSVFFAFCLNAMSESLADPNNPKTLLDRAIQWVLPVPSADVPEGTHPAVASSIRSITPNPFSPWSDGRGDTAIRLRVSEHAADHPARLDVIDINGRVVCNLLDQALPLGVSTASWDGRDASGQPVGAGVYYLRFETADGSHSSRAVVLR